MLNHLDRIIVNNYKSIRSLDLELGSLNILIGANGVGKSNFIGIFKFLNKILDLQLQRHTAELGGANSILYYGRKVSDNVKIDLSFRDKRNGYQIELLPTAEDNFIFGEEIVSFHDIERYSAPHSQPLGAGHKESKLTSSKNGRIAGYVVDSLKSWRLYHFHDTSNNAGVKQYGDVGNNRILMPDGSNLAAFLFTLQEIYPDYYRNIEDAVRMVAPFFEKFDLQPAVLNPEKIRLEWREQNHESPFNASSMSDGTLRFVCLATLLLQPSLPSLIILDEPELGLHPYAISIIAELLRSASEKTQVIVATQSVTLVNQFEPDKVIVLDRKVRDGDTSFKRLGDINIEEWIEDYGLGDLWEKNVFGGRP